jgi:hypothetical protein
MKGFRFIVSSELCPFTVCFTDIRNTDVELERDREERKRLKQQHVKNIPTLDPSVTAVGKGGIVRIDGIEFTCCYR